MLKKYTSYTLIAASLITGPALAGSVTPAPEDTQVYEPAPEPLAPAKPDWSGFYGGVELGYADVDTSVAGVDGDGAIGGLIAGYDFDLGDWVVGAGLDYDFASIDLGAAADLENVLRAKLRGGYKLGDGLLYGTAGYAKAYTDTLGNDDGYFAGAGYEHMITQSFSVGGEILYHEFDNFNASGVNVDATTAQIRGAFRF